MTLTIGKHGQVTLNGVRYRLQPLANFDPPPNNDPCYWCSAYRNMRLCDAICGHCNLDEVFIRST